MEGSGHAMAVARLLVIIMVAIMVQMWELPPRRPRVWVGVGCEMVRCRPRLSLLAGGGLVEGGRGAHGAAAPVLLLSRSSSPRLRPRSLERLRERERSVRGGQVHEVGGLLHLAHFSWVLSVREGGCGFLQNSSLCFFQVMGGTRTSTVSPQYRHVGMM